MNAGKAQPPLSATFLSSVLILDPLFHRRTTFFPFQTPCTRCSQWKMPPKKVAADKDAARQLSTLTKGHQGDHEYRVFAGNRLSCGKERWSVLHAF